MQVHCSSDQEIVNKLQELAKDMESKLDKWRESISLARREYYELNYYTTLQLLTLRERLGLFKSCSFDAAVSPDVLALLQCIHPQVDQDIVKKAVCIALSNSQLEDSSFTSNEGVSENEKKPSQPSVISQECSQPSVISQACSQHSVLSQEQHSEVSTLGNIQPITTVKPILTEEQKAIIAHVTKRVGCSTNLVLLAFDRLDGDDNQNQDYVQWCCSHMDLDSISEKSEHSDSNSEYLSDDMKAGDENHDECGSSTGQLDEQAWQVRHY